MIKKLHEHYRLFTVLKEDVGLTAARPVGEPIDVGGISPGAVDQKRVDPFLVHQRLNGLVPSCHLLIGKRRIVGSLPHKTSWSAPKSLTPNDRRAQPNSMKTDLK